MYRLPQRPERPYIPESLHLLAVTICVDRLVLWFIPWMEVPPEAVAAALVALGLLSLACALRKHVLPAALATCAALALISSSAQVARVMDEKALVEGNAASHFIFEIASDASKGTYGYRCRAHALLDGQRAADVWLSCPQELHRGERISCIGRTKELSDDSYGRSSFGQGVAATVNVVRITDREEPQGAMSLISGVRRQVLASFLEDSGAERAITIGSVCGYATPLQERGIDEAFAACGVSHLVAVSGGHLAVIASGLAVVLGVTRMKPRSRILLAGVLTWLFVLFCGMPVSAVRSWLMSMVATGAQLSGRRSHALSSVCCVAALMAWADPAVTCDVGYLLSVYAVAGLCIFSPYVGYALEVLLPHLPWIHAVPPKAMRWLLHEERELEALLAATLSAQLVTSALVLEVFGTFSFVAPLANMLLTLPFSVLICAGMLAAIALPLAPVRICALSVADAAGRIVLALVYGLCRLPYASLKLPKASAAGEVLSLALLALWVALWPHLDRKMVRGSALAAAGALCCLLFSWRFLAPARMVVLDVGQGDAILIQEGGSCVLVDCGKEGTLVAPLLREHVLHIDAVVLTHLHDDHVGGLADLEGIASVGRVLVAEGVKGHMPDSLAKTVKELTGSDAREISEGTTMQAGGFSFRVVWPKAEVSGEENGDSVEMVLSYAKDGRAMRALLTGDGEQDELRHIVDEVGKIDVLKVGHHGSEVSIDAEEAQKLSPELSIASAGEGNEYGHPRQECIDTLTAAGSQFLCTKDVGSVTVEPGRGGCAVYTERAFSHNS